MEFIMKRKDMDIIKKKGESGIIRKSAYVAAAVALFGYLLQEGLILNFI